METEFKITCPGCKTSMGHKGGKDKKLIHLDLMWSQDSGLYVECEHSDILMDNIESMDENYNPTFKEPYKSLIEKEKEKHETGQQRISDFPEQKGLFVALKQYAMYYLDEPDGMCLPEGFSMQNIDLTDTRTFKEIFESALVQHG